MHSIKKFNSWLNHLQGFRDSNGSNWGSISLELGSFWKPDSNWLTDRSSLLESTNLWRKLDASFSEECAILVVSFKLSTCWRQTWTASWTLTKNHSLPISSTTPDLENVSKTSRFGLEMAIYIQTKWLWRNLSWLIFLRAMKLELPEYLEVCTLDTNLLELGQHLNLYK